MMTPFDNGLKFVLFSSMRIMMGLDLKYDYSKKEETQTESRYQLRINIVGPYSILK